MKNICLLIDSLSGGGAERVVISLATELAKLGNRVDIIAFSNRNDYNIDPDIFNIHYIVLNSQAKKPSFFRKLGDKIKSLLIILSNAFNIKFLQRILLKENLIRKLSNKIRSLVIVFSIAFNIKFLQRFLLKEKLNALSNKIATLNIEFDVFISNLWGVDKLCIISKLPNLYCCIHRSISAEVGFVGRNRAHKKLFQLHLQQLYKNQNIITVSNGIEKDLLNFGIKPKSVQTIYNLFDFKYIQNQAQKYSVDEQDYIICVARLGTEKRHNLLINAYKKSNIKQKLLIFGKGFEENNIKKLIANFNLQDQVILKGFNPNPYPYIKNAKALILSSDVEGLPTVLIEALSLGVPVISTDSPYGPNEILVDELADFLSPVSDVNALAENIKKMMKDPVKIDKKYINKFNKEITVSQYLSLCK